MNAGDDPRTSEPAGEPGDGDGEARRAAQPSAPPPMTMRSGTGPRATRTYSTAPPQSARAMLELVGGASGMLDSAIPGAVFVGVFIATRNLTTPLWIAICVAFAILIYRLTRRNALRHALGGFAGVAVAAGLAVITGKPENYFVPTLALNTGYAAASAISLAVRWPLAGVVLGAVFGEGAAWRGDAARRRAYTIATALWLCMFALRVGVLFPLWLADQLVPLGIGRIALGYPLYALVVWLTWMTVSRTQPVRAEAPG